MYNQQINTDLERENLSPMIETDDLVISDSVGTPPASPGSSSSSGSEETHRHITQGQ